MFIMTGNYQGLYSINSTMQHVRWATEQVDDLIEEKIPTAKESIQELNVLNVLKTRFVT